MAPAKKFPCNTTRCFDSTIHPKKQKWDAITFRLQWRKHERVSVEDVENILRITDWAALFSYPENTSIKKNTGVSTWRILPAGKSYGLWKRTFNLSTGKEFLLYDTPHGKFWKKTGRTINPKVVISQFRKGVRSKINANNRTNITNSTNDTRLR